MPFHYTDILKVRTRNAILPKLCATASLVLVIHQIYLLFEFDLNTALQPQPHTGKTLSDMYTTMTISLHERAYML